MLKEMPSVEESQKRIVLGDHPNTTNTSKGYLLGNGFYVKTHKNQRDKKFSQRLLSVIYE